MSVNHRRESYDVVVIGGGLSGMCAALTSARHGVKTVLIQNRSMFGGNASAEVRMHILGASCHSSKPNTRETGIIDEILLENKKRNPYVSFDQFNVVMWEKIRYQENLTSYLNTNVDDVIAEDGIIKTVICHQNSTETEIVIDGKYFVDATGHGTVGVMAGAEYRIGSEGRDEFNEPTAPETANNNKMGCSLRFSSVDRQEPVKFERPFWAYHYTEEDLKDRKHANMRVFYAEGGKPTTSIEDKEPALPDFSGVDEGYWWIELGGDSKDNIIESEDLRDDLLRTVYGVWDHLKNENDHGVENYDLDWVEIVPGCRESRRLVGDYLLNENDIRSNRIFEDAVAYGGWPMDVHTPGGMKDLKDYPSHVYSFPGIYTIPYRSYYSKNVNNLFLAGRDISCTKMGMSSTRVMATCAVGGQAAGTAAVVAMKYGCSPREVGTEHIKELQQELLKDDCYIPGFKNEDEADLAKKAQITASSEKPGFEAVNVINGVARTVDENSNCWESEALDGGVQELVLKFEKPETISQLRITFDSNLCKDISPSMTKLVREEQEKHLPSVLVKDYEAEFYCGGKLICTKGKEGNSIRLNVIDIDKTECDEIKIKVKSTYGAPAARIFEVRVY